MVNLTFKPFVAVRRRKKTELPADYCVLFVSWENFEIGMLAVLENAFVFCFVLGMKCILDSTFVLFLFSRMENLLNLRVANYRKTNVK